MERYVNQLLEEIRSLMKTVPPCRSKGELCFNDDDFEEQMMEMEEHFLNGRGAEIVQLTGISEEKLPDAALLSENQLEKLVPGLTDLLHHYQFFPVFPEQLPARLKYEFLRNNWNSFRVPLLDYQLHHEFCEYKKEACPFPDYCRICDNDKDGCESAGKKEGAGSFIRISVQLDSAGFRDLMQQAHLPGNKCIREIFNYCDRRCEGCRFSSQCSAYVIGSEYDEIPDEEVLSESWMNELEGIYEKLIETVLSEKEKLDISAAELARNEGFDITLKRELIYRPEALQLLSIAEYYTKSLHEWLSETGIDRFRDRVGNTSVYETILWLQLPITTKIFRALIGEEEPEEDPVQNDRNGSAKVAILNIRKSLAAWCWILHKSEPLKEVAMKYAIILNDLLTEMEDWFPRAQEFIRPGFDQEEKDWEFV